MRSHRKRRGFWGDTMGIAGWVFADLFLGLAMLFMVYNTKGQLLSTPPPTTTSTRTPTVTPSVTHTATPGPMPTYTPLPTYTPYPTPERVGVEQDSEDFVIQPGTLEEKLLQIEAFCAASCNGRRAGFALVFGKANDVETGNQLASEGQALLRQAAPASFGDTSMEPLHYLLGRNEQADAGTILVKVYFLIGTPSE